MGKKSKAPPPPDYTALEEKTAASEKEAAAAKTLADRPNQTDIYGNTSTWTQDPNGTWSQTQALSGQNQELYNQQQVARGGLMDQATKSLSNPLSTAGLPEYSNYDPSKLQGVDVNNLGGGMFNMDPRGNSQEIQDATYKLLAPQREMARNSEIQRLKNQGLTEDSPAFQRAVTRLDQGDTEAQLKALLAGQTEYGNQFQRGLSENQSNFGQNTDAQKLAMALRTQQFGEQGAQNEQNANLRTQGLAEQEFMRTAPLQDLQQLIQTQSGYNPQFGQFSGATGTTGTDYYTAGKDQYAGAMGANNANNAAANSKTQGMVGLATAAAIAF